MAFGLVRSAADDRLFSSFIRRITRPHSGQSTAAISRAIFVDFIASE
jgi:hypothetical protein